MKIVRKLTVSSRKIAGKRDNWNGGWRHADQVMCERVNWEEAI